jgi:hypothetical protein
MNAHDPATVALAELAHDFLLTLKRGRARQQPWHDRMVELEVRLSLAVADILNGDSRLGEEEKTAGYVQQGAEGVREEGMHGDQTQAG